MPTTKYKYLSKNELQKANRRAIKAGGRALEPDYVERLPEGVRFPVLLGGLGECEEDLAGKAAYVGRWRYFLNEVVRRRPSKEASHEPEMHIHQAILRLFTR